MPFLSFTVCMYDIFSEERSALELHVCMNGALSLEHLMPSVTKANDLYSTWLYS